MRLVCIVGPTASGKTQLACDLAQELGAEIVSADSQQCYRGLDEGTAKPSADERARAPHHLLDVAEPEEQLDAAAWARLADEALAGMAARGKRALVVGGTGFWIRVLLRGLIDAPGASAGFRAALRDEARALGVPALHARLQERDPEAAALILPGDLVRIERALEVLALSGRTLSALQREHQARPSRHEALTLFLDPPRELLRARIDARAAALFASGAFARETRWLLARIEQAPAAARALKIIGYGESAQALRDGDWAEALTRTQARTRQYARRQRSWFAKEASEPAWGLDAMRLCERVERWYEGAPS